MSDETTGQIDAVDDEFDDLLRLEDRFYQEGYALGVKDGERAGRVEGRRFGLERGFEKFASMGALAGQCAVWQGRLESQTQKAAEQSPRDGGNGQTSDIQTKALPNSRLDRHLRTLSALTERESLSTQNNEEAVSDFDDRLKRAEGKAKVIQSILGESTDHRDAGSASASKERKKTGDNLEDFKLPQNGKLRQP